MPAISRTLTALADITVTLMLWGYFLIGFPLIFSPACIGAYFLAADREGAFQGILHAYCRSFFAVSRMLLPRLSLEIPPEVRSLRSAVVVSNHLSYLDPLLMIAIFRRHKTVVKAGFFHVPLFGWMLKEAGYMPPAAAENAGLMITQLERMEKFFASGGVLFIFPEGTRSRDGHIGAFQRGAFKIAGRRCLPVEVLVIRNTQALFRPGKFLFDATRRVCIRIERVGTLPPDGRNQAAAVAERMLHTRRILERHLMTVDPLDTAGA